MELIDKYALVAEIERRITEGEKVAKEIPSSAIMGLIQAYKNTLSIINSLEVKEVDFWHKQSEEDIDDSIIGWSMHSFICLMKDGTTQKFTGIQDESFDGSICKHLDCVDDNYKWEYDDITYWIEVPNIRVKKGEEV